MTENLYVQAFLLFVAFNSLFALFEAIQLLPKFIELLRELEINSVWLKIFNNSLSRLIALVLVILLITTIMTLSDQLESKFPY